MKSQSSSFRTVTRLLYILEVLAIHPSGLSLTELVTKLDAPKSSVFYLLQELVKSGYILYNERKKSYSVGPDFIRLGVLVMHNNTLQPMARPNLEILSEETGEDVYLGILADNHCLYVDKVEGVESVRLNVAVGFKRSLYHTSIGKLLLANFNEKDLENYLSEHDLQPTAKNTITDPSQLHRDLQKIRENQLSITNEESIDGIFSLAAPIKDIGGEIIAGVGVSVPVGRALPRIDYLKDRVKNAAAQISKRLGYNG